MSEMLEAGMSFVVCMVLRIGELTFQPVLGWKDGRFSEERLVQLDEAVLQRTRTYRKEA
jgi:hypothetical protein